MTVVLYLSLEILFFAHLHEEEIHHKLSRLAREYAWIYSFSL